jgi:cysteine desulfurase
MFGGGQERGLRPGTEGVPNAVALGLAVELAETARAQASAKMRELRAQLAARIAERVPSARFHVDATHAAPHILSVGFAGAPAEPLLHALESRGVMVSAGSACHAKDKKPSATLRAIGVPDDMGTLRFSLSRFSTEEEIALAADALIASLAEVS